MKPEKVRYIKKILLQRLNDLQFKRSQISGQKSIMPDNPSDIIDMAARDFDQGLELAMKSRERLLIYELQEALMRIERGVFGICEVCQDRISEKRLVAAPMSRLCIKCMGREGQEGNRGR